MAKASNGKEQARSNQEDEFDQEEYNAMQMFEIL